MQLRILFVDDEPLIADTFAMIFAMQDYECRTAYDGESALNMVREFAPHFVVSDVVMPRMNGFELRRACFELPHRPEVVLISGNAETAGLIQRERAAGDDVEVLPKGSGPHRLIEVIEGLKVRLQAQPSVGQQLASD